MRRFVLASVVGCVCFALQGQALAAPGDVDRSFGASGFVDVTPSTNNGSGYSRVLGMAAGPQDETFVLAVVRSSCGSISACTGIDIEKYGPDGAPVPLFGARSNVSLPVKTGESFAMVVDGAGRVIVATGGEDGIVLMRFGSDGSPDRSFGTEGRTYVDTGRSVVVSDLAIAPNGTIAVAGRARVSADGVFSGGSDLLVAHCRPDGSLDPKFAGSGVTVVDLSQWDYPGELAFVGDETAVAVAVEPNSGGQTGIARFEPDGRLLGVVGAWPRGGPKPPRFGRPEIVLAKPSGGIEIVGTAAEETTASSLSSSWILERRYGSRGVAVLSGFAAGGVDNAALDADERLVLGGTVRRLDANENKVSAVAVARRRPDGHMDRTFGAGRPVSVWYGSQSLGVATQLSGKIIVLAGSVPECIRVCPRTSTYALVRLLGGPSRARCHGRKATVVGTRRLERIVGTPHRDVIAALGGADKVFGLGGNDLICGGRGNDILVGGGGHDRLFGGPGKDERSQ